jgi:hypothetical protein
MSTLKPACIITDRSSDKKTGEIQISSKSSVIVDNFFLPILGIRTLEIVYIALYVLLLNFACLLFFVHILVSGCYGIKILDEC